MFKYTLSKNYTVELESDNYVADYLRSLGIEKVESFLGSPQKEDELDPFLLDNMQAGIEMVHKHIEKQSTIYLIVDSDTDGYTSAAIFINFIKENYPHINILYSVHQAKEHGVIVRDVPLEASLVVIIDAGTNQYEETEELIKKGYDVLIIDHHEKDTELIGSPQIVLINNQVSTRFNNKALSGAGMALKFIQAFDKTYLQNNSSSNYYDLAATGIVSDAMYSGTLDNNYIITYGLNHIHNQMLKGLLEQQAFSISDTMHPTKIDIAFYIAPIINAVIRVGTQDDKMELFYGFTHANNTEIFERTWRNVTKEETLYQKIARQAFNLRTRQNNIIDKALEKISLYIEQNNLQDNQIIIYKTSLEDENEIPKTLTGLVAMKIVAKYNKPALVVRPKKIDGIQYYQGSGRGKEAEGFDSLKDFLTETHLCQYASGHSNAFGVSLAEDNIPVMIERANSELSNIDFGTNAIEVFGIYNNTDMNVAAIRQFAMNTHLYGNGIAQPKFAFELFVNKAAVRVMGAKANTIKFTINGISFIKFFAKEYIDKLQGLSAFKLTCIGSPAINHFNGTDYLQVTIDEMDISPYQMEDLF